MPDIPIKMNGLLVVTKRRVLWLTFFGIVVTVFSGWLLYEWYASGLIYAPGRSKPSRWISYSDDPDLFAYSACMQIACFVFFGIGSVVWGRKLLLHRYIDPENEPLPIKED